MKTSIAIYIINYLSLLFVLGLLIMTLLGFETALAHVFFPDKNASLLAVANQLKSELKLVSNNLEQSNYDLALEHLADIKEIQSRKNTISSSFPIPYLDELGKLIESLPTGSDQQVLSSRINETIGNTSRFLDNKIVSLVDAQDLRNSTIQALNIANMTDEILREYAIAYGIDPVIATSGSSMASLMNMNMPNMSSSIDSSPASMDMDMDDNVMRQMEIASNPTLNASRIMNISNYQNAQELATMALEIFRYDLKPLELPNTTRSFLTTEIRSSSVAGLEDAISLLINSINEKKPYSDIMQIVHGPIHTDLFLAYDLKMIAD